MGYDVERQKRDTVHALAMTRRIAAGEVSKALGEMLPAVYEFAAKNGATMTGPPFARYSNWSEDSITLSAGLPVAGPAEGAGDVEPLTIPAGEYARTVHHGSYENLGDAHSAIESWIESEGLNAGGITYELYLTDPGEHPNEEEWQTEILRELSAE